MVNYLVVIIEGVEKSLEIVKDFEEISVSKYGK